MPFTETSGLADKYCELILPPKDFPETKRGSLGFSARAFAMAALMVAWATGGESGRPFLFSVNGKLNRSVAMSTLHKASANVSINEWSIPAPAPCASVKMHLGLSGTTYLADTWPIEGDTFSFKDCT